MKKTIMIVDDSVSVREVVAMTLTSAGYEVIKCTDGKDALKKLSSEAVSLIISDVNMPNMDGYTFMKELKQLPEHKFTPAIMLSTESSRSAKDNAKEIGVTGWIVKPVNPDKLIKAVSKLLA